MDVTYHLRFDTGDGVWDLYMGEEWVVWVYWTNSNQFSTRRLPTSLKRIPPKGPNIWT